MNVTFVNGLYGEQLRFDKGKSASQMTWSDIRAGVYRAFSGPKVKNDTFIKFDKITDGVASGKYKPQGPVARFLGSLYLYVKTSVVALLDKLNPFKNLGDTVTKALTDVKGELPKGEGSVDVEKTVKDAIGDEKKFADDFFGSSLAEDEKAHDTKSPKGTGDTD